MPIYTDYHFLLFVTIYTIKDILTSQIATTSSQLFDSRLYQDDYSRAWGMETMRQTGNITSVSTITLVYYIREYLPYHEINSNLNEHLQYRILCNSPAVVHIGAEDE